MTISIHTNSGAGIALQSLNKINSELAATTKAISTGYKVADAGDDGAVFGIAQGLRGDLKAIDAVSGQLQSSQGLLSVANTAATAVSNSLNDLKSVLVKLEDNDINASTRTQYQNQYNSIKDEISGYISNASFNGQNILNTTTAVSVISNPNGGQLSISAFNLATSVVSALGSAPTTAAAAATLASGGFATATAAVNTALASYGSDGNRVNNQISYLSAVSDATTTGLGALVDANLAKESAKLQALQTQQQLGTQALSIANQAPQTILSLFRG